MTNEKNGRTNEHEGQRASTGCCSPQAFAEMMAKCGADMQCDCGAMMQAMLKGGCCRPEEE